MSWIFMLHLIADFTLIVTEGSMEDSKDGDGGWGGEPWAKKSVCEKRTAYSRGTVK